MPHDSSRIIKRRQNAEWWCHVTVTKTHDFGAVRETIYEEIETGDLVDDHAEVAKRIVSGTCPWEDGGAPPLQRPSD